MRLLLTALICAVPTLAKGAADRVAVEKLIQSLDSGNIDTAVFTESEGWKIAVLRLLASAIP